MAPKRRILFFILLIAVLAVFAWSLLRAPSSPPDLIYDGHPLSYWTHQGFMLISDTDGHFALAIYEIPPNEPPTNRFYPSEFMKSQPQFDSNAVPFLLHALQTHNGPFHAPYAILWPKLPASLQKHLPPPDDAATIRAHAALLLSRIKPISPEVIPALLRVSKEDSEPYVRSSAISSLAFIGQPSPQISESLSVFLNDPNQEVRSAAATALRLLSPAALK